MSEGAGDPKAEGEGADLRAMEIVTAAAGSPPYDPSARWERALGSSSEMPLFFHPKIETRLDPEGWRRIDLSRHEYSIPPELQSDLTNNTPQAALRDLDRPGPVYGAMFEVREGTQLIGLWEEGARLIAAAQHRPENPTIVSASEMLLEEMARHRRFFLEPWQPILPDDAPRRSVKLYSEDFDS